MVTVEVGHARALFPTRSQTPTVMVVIKQDYDYGDDDDGGNDDDGDDDDHDDVSH